LRLDLRNETAVFRFMVFIARLILPRAEQENTDDLLPEEPKK